MIGLVTDSDGLPLCVEVFEIDFITALSYREVLKLVEENGPCQMKLFDEKGIADVLLDGVFRYDMNREVIPAAARLDGVYLIYTSLTPDKMATPCLSGKRFWTP